MEENTPQTPPNNSEQAGSTPPPAQSNQPPVPPTPPSSNPAVPETPPTEQTAKPVAPPSTTPPVQPQQSASVQSPSTPPTATAQTTAASVGAPAGFSNRIDLTGLNQAVEKVKGEVKKYIVGQNDMIELLVIAILADGHVLLEGVPGVAKTLTSKLLAKSISVDFSRIQFTPDLMPSDVIGTSIYSQKSNEFEFKKGPIFSNIVLIDEINRAPAKTQSALFESMEERQVSVDGTTYKLDEPFLVLATQNPVEQEGTYRLPEAQLDRFLFKVEVNYPQLAEEQQLLLNYHQNKNKIDLGTIQAVLSAKEIVDYRGKIAQVHVDHNLINYIAQIVHATRDNLSLFLGASPRASIAILSAAKATAAIRGRDFITPDDIKFIAPSVLKHRIILTPEKEMEGVLPDEVIMQIIESVEVPR